MALETDAHRARRGPFDDPITDVDPSEYVGPLTAGRTYDVVMIAAPVFDRRGDSLVSITLLGLEPGLTVDQVAAYGERVRDAGLVATRRSGGRVPTR